MRVSPDRPYHPGLSPPAPGAHNARHASPPVIAVLTRRHALLLAPAGVLGAGLAAALVWLRVRPEPAIPIGGPFELLDGDGRTVTDRQFRGKWMLVYFGYTHCPDACPTALQDMVTAWDGLGDKKRDVALVFVTVDPERDTPPVMKDYVAAFEAPIVALSGSTEAVGRAAREYRVYFAKHPTRDGYDMDHSSIIYLMDPSGRFAGNFTHETPPDAITAKLKAVL